MAITIPITQVGLIRATEILHDVRNTAALRHETEPRTVSVVVEPFQQSLDARGDDEVPGQSRLVDVRV